MTMFMMLLAHPLTAVGWVVVQLLAGFPEDGLFHAALAVTAFTALVLSWLGRFGATWSGTVLVLALVPPLAPLVMSHTCAQLLFRVAAGLDEDDRWVPVCRGLGRQWLRFGNIASAMAVVLLYYWWDAFERQVVPGDQVAFTDPLRLMSDAFAPFVKGAFLVISVLYAVRFVRTVRVVLVLRGRADVDPA